MDNLQPIKDAAVKAIEAIKGFRAEREDTNAGIEAVITGLEAMGLNRHAFKMALKYSEMDENQRKNFDFAYNLVREAIGQPLQPDLFEEADDHPDPDATNRDPDLDGDDEDPTEPEDPEDDA